jgi:hypothetical protein
MKRFSSFFYVLIVFGFSLVCHATSKAPHIKPAPKSYDTMTLLQAKIFIAEELARAGFSTDPNKSPFTTIWLEVLKAMPVHSSTISHNALAQIVSRHLIALKAAASQTGALSVRELAHKNELAIAVKKVEQHSSTPVSRKSMSLSLGQALVPFDDEDAEFARRIEQQRLEDEALARKLEDEEYARQLQQELEDQEFARQLRQRAEDEEFETRFRTQWR